MCECHFIYQQFNDLYTICAKVNIEKTPRAIN